MAEPIVINAETREITVPESERSFGVAGEHNVARKHFRINGRIVDGMSDSHTFAPMSVLYVTDPEAEHKFYIANESGQFVGQ